MSAIAFGYWDEADNGTRSPIHGLRAEAGIVWIEQDSVPVVVLTITTEKGEFRTSLPVDVATGFANMIVSRAVEAVSATEVEDRRN